MRCLHCGSTLSAFKKLTDSDFCSMEHRDQFYTEQQQLIRERLKYSRTRLHRLSRDAADARAAAPKTSPVLEAQAPAKIAAFLASLPGLHDRSLCLQWVSQINPELSPANPPARRERFRERRLLLPLIPDFPWARYNPGLLSIGSFEPAQSDGEIAYGSVFKLSGAVAFGFTPASLATLRRPEVITLPARSVSRLRMARPKTVVSFGPVSLCIVARQCALPEFGYRSFIELAPTEQLLPRRTLEASAIEIATGLAISGSLRLRSEQGARSLRFLDRAFKMRPRAGVLPADLPLMRQMTPETLASTASPVRPSDRAVASSFSTGANRPIPSLSAPWSNRL